jgi:hypothetical protein
MLLKFLLKIVKKSFLFSFYFPIQNLCKILSWSLNKSCRELNSKQLSFWAIFRKGHFIAQNDIWNLIFEKFIGNEIGKCFSCLMGRRLTFSPVAEAGSAPHARARVRSLAHTLPRPRLLSRGPAHASSSFPHARDACSDRAQTTNTVWRPHAGAVHRVDNGGLARPTSRRHTRASASTPLPTRSLSLSRSLWRTRTRRGARPRSPPLATTSATPFRRRRTTSAWLSARHAPPPPPLLRTSRHAVLLATVRLNWAFPRTPPWPEPSSSRSAADTLAHSLSPCIAVPCSPFPHGPRACSISPRHGRHWPLAAGGRRAAAMPRAPAWPWPFCSPPSVSLGRKRPWAESPEPGRLTLPRSVCWGQKRPWASRFCGPAQWQ